MSYWVRAYCTTETVPTIRSLLDWLRKEAVCNAEAPNELPRVLDSPTWKSFELVYDPQEESLLIECNRNTGKRSLCAGEAKGELESLDDVEESEAKTRVADCLSRTKFIICCTVLGDHHHKEAFKIRAILDYFVDHCGAILDVEDEGFYSCSDMPLLGRCADED